MTYERKYVNLVTFRTVLISRIAGVSAHVLEQYGNNRLIRPRSDYDGEIDRIHSNIDSR